MTDLVPRDDAQLSPETAEIVSVVVRDVMAPIMQSIGKMLEHNTQAMEQIAAAQQITSDRIASLEKRVRLQTPMSKSQENCINTAIRARARELLDPRGFADDKKAVTKLGGVIRKSVLARYGVGSLREAPAYDYETAMKQVSMWNDRLAVRDIEKEARAREAAAVEEAERPAAVDAASQVAGAPD
ncbi:MAG: hypothetical protein IJ649_00125 [Oscillospiraceae bacterium]|nr:hypothetical protein [Oscillospiraceae bacterium]